MAQTFQPPEFWNFKPFYTIQPVLETREKQLNCWVSLIIGYCSYHKLTRLDPTNFPYFKNNELNREVSFEGKQTIISRLIKLGNAEWEDSSKTTLRIILKTPESLAGQIYEWATKNDLLDNVMTLYELHSGDDYQDSGFYGIDPIILKRALVLLQTDNKCTILEGSASGEEGVKFHPIT